MYDTSVIIDVVVIDGIVGLAQGIFANRTADFVTKKGAGKDSVAATLDTLVDILYNDIGGYKISVYLQGQSLVTVRWALKLLREGYFERMSADELADKMVGRFFNRDSYRWQALVRFIGVLKDKLEAVKERQISFKAQTSIYKYEIVGAEENLGEIAVTGIRSLFFRKGYNEEFALKIPEAPFFSGHLSIEHSDQDGKGKSYGWINPRSMNTWQVWLKGLHEELVSKVRAEVGVKKVPNFIG